MFSKRFINIDKGFNLYTFSKLHVNNFSLRISSQTYNRTITYKLIKLIVMLIINLRNLVYHKFFFISMQLTIFILLYIILYYIHIVMHIIRNIKLQKFLNEFLCILNKIAFSKFLQVNIYNNPTNIYKIEYSQKRY